MNILGIEKTRCKWCYGESEKEEHSTCKTLIEEYRKRISIPGFLKNINEITYFPNTLTIDFEKGKFPLISKWEIYNEIR